MNENHQSNKVIEVQGITKRFGNFTAVERVSFEVKRGQIFGFLGPNGSGKTTTIRMLLGLLPPSEGTAFVLGHDVRKQAIKIRARLGYMSQRFTLYNDLTVKENLLFYARSYGLRNNRLRERINYVLNMADLKGRENLTPPKLSGGWRQRLALGAAILHQPDIVFLDEPTAGVDPLSRRTFWDLLYNISAEGTSIFVTTHYMDEAEHCEQLGFIYMGQLIAGGSPTEIKQTYVPGEVIQLTPSNSASAMNILNNAHQKGELGDSISVGLYGAQIHVLTRDGEDTRNRIASTLKQAQQAFDNIDIIPPSLENAFIRLVELQNDHTNDQ